MDPILETVRGALGAACDVKRRCVIGQGIGTDLVPMLELSIGGDFLGAFAMMGERATVLSLIPIVIGLTDADRAMIVAEGFTGPADAETKPGDLAARFGAGDAEVHEDVQVLGFDRDGPWAVAHAAYRYHGRDVAFDEPHEDGDDHLDDDDVRSSAFAIVVVRGFEMQAKRIGMGEHIETIAKMTGWPTMARRVAEERPPRNAPCPCGSGRRAKHCCWVG